MVVKYGKHGELMPPEANLEDYLAKHGGKYVEIYQNIKKASQKIWLRPRLAWYTDHGAEHSERIIFHLNRLCAGLLRSPETGSPHYGLVPEEVFLLLASAWLHDVGMQDLTDLRDQPVEKLTGEDWDVVRKRHPEKSYDIIMEHAAGSTTRNEFDLGIRPHPEIHAPLALICKGHGSDFFHEIMETIPKNTFNLGGKGTKIRGELLTALLLMADELDLHLSRVVPEENYPLSRISRLHHYRHHYIQHVEVIAGFDGQETHRSINITFRFPPVKELDKRWMGNLIKWVKRKIEKEANRTASYLHEGFSGHFSWAQSIVNCYTETALEHERKIMEPDVRFLLAAEVQKTIDWKELTGLLKRRFKEKEAGVVCLTGSPEQAVEHFITFINCVFCSIVQFNSPEPPLAILNFPMLQNYHTIEDVFEKIDAQLGKSNRLRTAGDFSLVILQHPDQLEQELFEDIYEKIIKKLQADPKNILLLVITEREMPRLSGLTTYNLPDKFEEKDIRDYLMEIGYTDEMAQIKTKECLEHLRLHEKPSAQKCFEVVRIVSNEAVR